MICNKCRKPILSGVVTCHDCTAQIDPQALADAIAYFTDAACESDEIMADCTPDVQAELTEQTKHFKTALAAMRACIAADIKPSEGGLRNDFRRHGGNYEPRHGKTNEQKNRN